MKNLNFGTGGITEMNVLQLYIALDGFAQNVLPSVDSAPIS